jgi:glutaryl-CoA dehydrogenase
VTDFYRLDEKLTAAERDVRDRLRDFCAREVTPVINGYWERAEFPFELIPKIASLNLAGGVIEGYGCPGMSATAAGLVSMEWARADGSMGTFFGVHSNLAMQTVHVLGSEEQRERWLPDMARLEKVGAFALTEPDHGSDAVHLETRVRRDGDSYVLDGAKRWIGNASFADLTIVWARDEDGHVGGYVVEKGTPGFAPTVIKGKTSLRAVWQADIALTGVRVPAENRLPGCRNFRDVARVLTLTRYTVAWRALGVALAAYEAALDYAKRRQQFGRPIAAYQLVQDKLSRMLGEITAM